MRKYRSVIRLAAPWPGLLLLAAAASAETPETARAFLKIIDRPRVPLYAQVEREPDLNGLERYRFTFASEAGQRVPGILVRPKSRSGRLPVVIALHGTGGTKRTHEDLLSDVAARGFLGVAIDGRYHGERSRAGKGSDEYNDAILRAYRTGEEHPFYYDTVWDLMRLIDYLETRDDVDPARIGMFGTSKGGIETYLATAVDPRIRASVPCIGVQSFRWGLEHDAWQQRVATIGRAARAAAAGDGVEKLDPAFVRKFYDRVVPGIYTDFDGPAMLKLIAPRPLLVINGEKDSHTPLPGVLECVAAAKQAYAAAGAPEKFEFLLEKDTEHKVNPDARQRAIEFLTRWLTQ